MPSLPSVQLANTFIERFGEENDISHLKLQKLCYFCYGWWLALRPNRRPFCEDKPQVWKFGPVFYPIYSRFNKFKDEPIRERRSVNPFQESLYIPVDGSQKSQFVDWTWKKYGKYSAIELSDMTHDIGTPWRLIAEKYDFEVPQFCEMSDEINRKYFRTLAKEAGYIKEVESRP